VSGLDTLLRHERAVVGGGLAALTLLAWVVVWRGAGMGMSALAMTSVTLFPHVQADAMKAMEPPEFPWATVLAMWWVMMIAMMTPSAAPLVLLYRRVARQAVGRTRANTIYVPSLFLILGYLVVWLGFSGVATALQYVLQRDGVISRALWSTSALLSAAVLLAAGAYQLSPLKRTCLRHCRGPVEFLTNAWRPGRIGAFLMGLEHGVWCLGCCWMLMTLLFVGGVMNVVWIALLALLVLAEKLAPAGATVGRAVGVVLIAWGIATLAV
jgi:predicted metal-binding membrane protein